MANKNPYYELDDTPIGSQDRTKAQIKKDAEITSKYIKAMKEGKPFIVSEKAARYTKAK